MDFNLGKDQAKDIMPYCRTAIEKYIYQKLNPNINAIYAYKNQDKDIKFRDRQLALKEGYKKEYGHKAFQYHMMDELGIKKKF